MSEKVEGRGRNGKIECRKKIETYHIPPTAADMIGVDIREIASYCTVL